MLKTFIILGLVAATGHYKYFTCLANSEQEAAHIVRHRYHAEPIIVETI
jgi:hypothetical protein